MPVMESMKAAHTDITIIMVVTIDTEHTTVTVRTNHAAFTAHATGTAGCSFDSHTIVHSIVAVNKGHMGLSRFFV